MITSLAWSSKLRPAVTSDLRLAASVWAACSSFSANPLVPERSPAPAETRLSDPLGMWLWEIECAEVLTPGSGTYTYTCTKFMRIFGFRADLWNIFAKNDSLTLHEIHVYWEVLQLNLSHFLILKCNDNTKLHIWGNVRYYLVSSQLTFIFW